MRTILPYVWLRKRDVSSGEVRYVGSAGLVWKLWKNWKCTAVLENLKPQRVHGVTYSDPSGMILILLILVMPISANLWSLVKRRRTGFAGGFRVLILDARRAHMRPIQGKMERWCLFLVHTDGK